MPDSLTKAELIAQLQRQATSLGMTLHADGQHGVAAALESIRSKWWLGGRKVTYRMSCGLNEQDRTAHYREVVIEASWGLPPPTLSLETTRISGMELSGRRTDVSPGGGGSLDFAEMRQAFERTIVDAGWTFRFEGGRMP